MSMRYTFFILEELRNIEKCNQKRKSKKKNHPESMNVRFNLSHTIFPYYKERKEWSNRSREKSSTIERWKRKNIDNSKIDRYHRDNEENHPDSDTNIHHFDHSCTHSNWSCNHSFRLFPVSWCSWNYEILECLSENIHCHIREHIRLMNCILERFYGTIFLFIISIDIEIAISDIHSDFSIFGCEIHISFTTISG